jgi:hypothetical protein
MEKTYQYPTRYDLVKNFPSSYTFQALTLHFGREYFKIAGHSPSKQVIDTLMNSFKKNWKNARCKERFFINPSCIRFFALNLDLR